MAEQQLAAERRTHTTQLRELLRRVRVAEQRESDAVTAAAVERAENRVAERWWAESLLRAKQSLPLSAAKPASNGAKPPTPFEQLPAHYDPGELAALIATGAQYGQSAAEVTAMYRREKGLDL